jgi:ankyrin repeat protein
MTFSLNKIDNLNNDCFTLFHVAVYKKDLPEIRRLLDDGVDLNIATTNESIHDGNHFSQGTTALHIASKMSELAIVRLLLDEHANIDVQEKWG